MKTKAITLKTYIIKDLSLEYDKLNDILDKMLIQKYKSEKNTNTWFECIEKLDGYCYVPNHMQLYVGRYVRYLYTKNPLNIELKLGGFVIDDNGYTVILRNERFIYRVSKKNALFFMTITHNDRMRLYMNNLL